MIDSVIVGFNDTNFEQFVSMVRSMGTDTGAWRDLRLHSLSYQGKPYRSMDLLNRFYLQDKKNHPEFSNFDYFWPVVMVLGTYLARHGFSFDYVNLFHREKEKLRRILENEEVLTVAITTTLYVSPEPILEVIEFVRGINDQAKIVVGGPFIDNQIKWMDEANLQQLLQFVGADYYIISHEGERAYSKLLEALKTGGDLDSVENLAYRKGDKYVRTQTVDEYHQLAENMIDYSLFPQEDTNEFMHVRTAKSCPFGCLFCGFPERAGKYTYLTVDQVEAEFKQLADRGVTTLTFVDDTFNVPKKRFKDMLRMMARNGFGFRWNCFYRSDHGDPETIELMGKAGCEGVFLGVESGSDKMLQLMNKTSRRKNYMEAIPLFREQGIATYTSLIVGFPGETWDTVAETISLLEEARPDYYRTQLWYLDPVTPVWRQRERFKLRGLGFNWTHETMDNHEACDLMDRVFLCVENSDWLPQQGFEMWSLFYLNRKGMSRQGIKEFLRAYNFAVRRSLLEPGKEPDGRLMRCVEAAARFESDERADPRPVELVSGSRYLAAEKFWIDRLGACPDRSPVLADEEAEALGGWVSGATSIAASTLRGLSEECQASERIVLLSAFLAALARPGKRGSLPLILPIREDGQESPLPVLFDLPRRAAFATFVKRVAEQLREAAGHRLFNNYLLGNAWLLSKFDRSSPPIDVGFIPDDWQGAGMDQLLQPWPQAKKNLSLLLGTSKAAEGGDLSLKFLFRKGIVDADKVKRLSRDLNDILQAVSRNPRFLMRDLVFEGEDAAPSAMVAAESSQAYLNR